MDLAVIGAGPAGAAAAAAAAGRGLEVVLIGPRPPAGRGLQSVPPEGVAALEHLVPGNIVPRAWFSGIQTPYGFRPFAPAPNGLGLGAHLDRDALDDALRRSAVRAGAQWLDRAAVAVRPQDCGFTVSYTGGGECYARRIVLAAGRRRNLARALGMRSRVLSPPLLVATGQRPLHERRLSVALFLPQPDGWLWIAPLGDGSAVWTSAARAGTPAADRLARAGHVSAATWLISIPASGRGWLAAGDAVCALDPSWGRGLLFALTSGEAAGLVSAQAVMEEDVARQQALEIRYSEDLLTFAGTQAAQLASHRRTSSPGQSADSVRFLDFCRREFAP
jgi:flavin-dependent dehydrogenase